MFIGIPHAYGYERALNFKQVKSYNNVTKIELTLQLTNRHNVGKYVNN
jgi:hypothetical protein